MKNTKAVQVLASLSETEIKEFSDFVNSPYFNSNKNLSRMLKLLRKYYPDFEEKKIEKEIIFSKLFPSKPYNEQIMKNLSSDMLQLALEFLAVNKYRNRNLYDKELDIVSELNLKRLDNIFESKLKKVEKVLSDSTHMIHPLFFHLHKIETIKTQFLLSRDRQKDVAENVMRSGDYLIYYFITELTRVAIDIKANISSFNVQHQSNLVFEVLEKFDFKHIIGYLKEHNYRYSEILNVYYHRLLALLECTDENYYTYKSLLIEHLDKFSPNETASLLDSLHNMSVLRVNAGAENGIREEFDVIRLKLSTNTLALRTGGRISMLSFRNIIFTSVWLNEIKWAEDFVEKYIDKVFEDSKESLHNYALGIIEYAKKNYDTAVGCFNKVSLDNPFFVSDSKTHIAIIFFEQGFYDSCISVLDSFRHLLSSREDFSDILVEVNLHFINSLTGLIKASSGSKKQEALLKIKEKLTSLKMVNHKGWLLKKTDELLAAN